MDRTSNQAQHIVVLGGGYAGVLAATRLARALPREAARVTLINGATHFVERTRLHQLGAIAAPPAPAIADLLGDSGVELALGWAERLDLAGHEVVLRVDGAPQSIGYDTLLVALGSRIDRSTVPGAAEHTRTIDDGRPLDLGSLPAQATVAVVGAGLTGIELATEIAESYPHLRVRLVSREHPAAPFSPAGRRALLAAFAELGVDVVADVAVSEVRAKELVLAAGPTLPFDLCLWSAGFRAPPLAAEAGLAVDTQGRIRVDAEHRSISHPEVMAAGDAACTAAPWGEPLRMGCVTAMPLAAAAADSLTARLTGGTPRSFRFAFGGQCVSLGRRRALIQMVRADDRPLDWVLTGKLAATIKEQILRYTVRSLVLSGSGRFRYRWQQRGLPFAAARERVLPA